MPKYITVKWNVKAPTEEESLKNLKRQLEYIEEEAEERKLRLFKEICNSTKLFTIGDPKEILKQDVMHEIWKELFESRKYYTTKKSLERFKNNILKIILKKFGNPITIDIPLLNLPEDHPDWVLAKRMRSVGDINISGEWLR